MIDFETPSQTMRRLQRQIARLRRDAAAWRSQGQWKTAAELGLMMGTLRVIVAETAQSSDLATQVARRRRRRC